MMQAPRLIFSPISPLIVLVAGILSIVLPALYFLAEFELMRQQSAGPRLIQFNFLNNVAMLVIECAGLAMLLGTFMSRSHWLFSAIIAVLSAACAIVSVGVCSLELIARSLR
jgi:hypothetical protein